jgi:hypothetical protein
MPVTLAVQPSFAPDTSVGTTFGTSSTNIALPGTPGSDAYVRIVNIGMCPLFFKLGTANTVTVTITTGVCVLPGHEIFLTIGSNTFIAGIANGIASAGQQGIANITTGN